MNIIRPKKTKASELIPHKRKNTRISKRQIFIKNVMSVLNDLESPQQMSMEVLGKFKASRFLLCCGTTMEFLSHYYS